VTSGEVGVAFNSGAMTVTGGSAPYTFSVSGTLPAGLSLNALTGAVTGTPTASGSFSIKVTDKNGITATGTCAITIVAGPSLSCSSVTSGEVGVAFNSGAMTVTGGSAPYTFSVSGTLPAGLSLNASTGAVTGTPTAAGSFSIKVTDAKGAIITSNCTITIAGTAGPSCVFGVASAYNLVALTGNISDSADITGRIAADGQVTQATTIGTKLRTSDLYISEASKNGGPWAIVAAGGIPTSNSFNVNAGGNVYSSTATSASFNFANENYSGSPYENSKLVTGGSSPINFSTLQTEMYSLTKQLAGLTANGAVCSVNSSGKIVAGGGCPTSSTSYNPSWIVLYGTSATTNIFNLTQAQFQGSNNLDFVVPAGSTVIVNIAGTSDTLQSSIYFNGATVTDANASSILFNFATATTVTINAQFDATLLAPYAHLSGGSQMGGTFIAASVGSTGEVHYDAFTSTLPITGACSQ
jgi:choice-of-anchor A domain-containing protein